MAYSAEQADRVRRMLADRPGLSEKQMFGGLAFLLGGNMAVGVHGEQLIVRVDPCRGTASSASPGRSRSTLAPAVGSP